MTVVFLSYAHADRDLAGRIVRGFKAAGVDAWWDEKMPGVDWRQALERQIGELDGVVVLWTPASKDEAAVKDAARLALPAGKLINAAAGASPPFPYESADGASLGGRRGPFRMDDARRNGRGPRECGERREGFGRHDKE